MAITTNTTTYYKNMIISNMFKLTGVVAFPTNYYIGLSRTEPKEDGTGVAEPATSGTGYARVLLTNLSTPVNGKVTNKAEIILPLSLTDWFPAATPATHLVIFDATTAGKLLMFGTLTKSRIIQSNSYFSWPVGELSISTL